MKAKVELFENAQCDAAALKDSKVTTYAAGDGLFLVPTPRTDGTRAASRVQRYRAVKPRGISRGHH